MGVPYPDTTGPAPLGTPDDSSPRRAMAGTEIPEELCISIYTYRKTCKMSVSVLACEGHRASVSSLPLPSAIKMSQPRSRRTGRRGAYSG